jgi:hypothetical protein
MTNSSAASPTSESPRPASNRKSGFTTSLATVPAGGSPLSKQRSGSTSSTNTDSPDAASRDELIRLQREELNLQKQARHQAFVERHEDAVVSSVPLEVRLRCLLSEGRRYERDRAVHRDDEPDDVRTKRIRYIDASYRNLIEDVRRRSAVIAAHNPPAQHQHALGSEAIGCYSSMLPWTEGVLIAEAAPPQSPLMDGSADTEAAARSAATRGRRMATNKANVRAASAAAANRRDDAASSQTTYRAATPEPACPYRFSIPQRLATDTRKLAAVTAARRKRLQTLAACPMSPNGPA